MCFPLWGKSQRAQKRAGGTRLWEEEEGSVDPGGRTVGGVIKWTGWPPMRPCPPASGAARGALAARTLQRRIKPPTSAAAAAGCSTRPAGLLTESED